MVAVTAVVAALCVACGETASDIPPPAVDIAPTETEDGTPATGETDSPSTGADEVRPTPEPSAFCEVTRTYFEACGNEGELTCGASGFDAWCTANDALNSEAFRQAETSCLTTKNCDGRLRRDCDYTFYGTLKPTTAQKALVTSYCKTCAPNDVSGCQKRSVTYDKKAGIQSVPDIFIAAWELSDALVKDITAQCTGSALGVDETRLATCADEFAKCAGDLFLDRVPDCTK